MPLSREALLQQALTRARERGHRVAQRRLAWRWLLWGAGKALLWGAPIGACAAAAWWLWSPPWHR